MSPVTVGLGSPVIVLGMAWSMTTCPVPAQATADDLAALVLEMRRDASSERARQAMLAVLVPQLATQVLDGSLDREISIDIFGLLGELGPLAVETLPDLYAGFAELPPEVWPAALAAFSKIGPYERARLNTRFLLEPILEHAESNPGDHDELFRMWIQLDERLRGHRQYRGTESWLEHDWGLRLGPLIDELGRRGRGASAALPGLKDYLDRGLLQPPTVIFEVDGVTVRYPHRAEGLLSAARAMVKVDPDHPDSLAAHAVLLRENEVEVRERALTVLRRAGPEAAVAVPFLKANLLEAPPEGIVDSCIALGEIGEPAQEAIIALEMLSEHEDRRIASGAEWALEQLRDR